MSKKENIGEVFPNNIELNKYDLVNSISDDVSSVLRFVEKYVPDCEDRRIALKRLDEFMVYITIASVGFNRENIN